MSDTLYDDDILAWSEQQARLLRRAADGERVNGLDWPNLIEEVESVGRSQLQACEGLILQALRHLLKCAGWPDNPAVGHWRAEAATFLPQADDAFSPSMRQKIDLPRLYARARKAALLDEMDGAAIGPVVETCPFSLDDLLTQDPDIVRLVGALKATA